MKKHLIAAAALATLSTAAFAQSSVTVYGFIDAGILTSNNASSTGQSTTQMTNGQWFPSMLGFTGTEDLGGGLKANFNLQTSLENASGKAGRATASGTNDTANLFDRYASVGLSGSFGKIDLGKQIDIMFLQSFVNGVIPTHANSLAVNGLYSYGATGVLSGGLPSASSNNNANAQSVGSRISNAVVYVTPTFNGLKAQVQHIIGGTAGDSSKNSGTAVIVNYDANGVSLNAGTESVNGLNGNKIYEKTLVGAKTTVGAFNLAAQAHTYKSKDGTSVDVKAYELGVATKVGSAGTVGLNYESFDDKANNIKPSILTLKAKYDFSKRTYAYTMISSYDKEAAGNILQGYGDFKGQGNKKATGVAVGMVHSF
jgi:predicted porin